VRGRETAEERAERRAAELQAEVDSLRAERDEACEELETIRALVEGEAWAGLVVLRERDKARDALETLVIRCGCTRKSYCGTCDLALAVLPETFRP